MRPGVRLRSIALQDRPGSGCRSQFRFADELDLVALDLEGCPAHFYMARLREGGASSSGGAGTVRGVAGRGLCDDTALLSCLGEAAESIGTRFRGDEPRISATAADLGKRACHPNDLMLISDRQYQSRLRWNALHGAEDWVPPPFDEGRSIEWVEATTPDGRATRCVPCTYVYAGDGGEANESRFCVANSNGCAAGSSVEEATLNGFLELVERDGAAMWWFGRHRRPAVDAGSVPELAPLLAWHGGRGRVLEVLDLTTDFGIPIFAAVSASESGRAVAVGTSAHFDARRAMISAVTEMIQVEISIAMYEACGRPASAPHFGLWLSEVTWTTQSHLRPSNEPVRRIDDYPPPEHRPSASLDRAVRLCEERGLELLRIDLSRKALGVPVVRVIVPGLRPLKARFAPGRLYDVPLQLGWRRNPLTEKDLNDSPML
jgi:thiazole/oxazole-forming peptide maturase SagD family component